MVENPTIKSQEAMRNRHMTIPPHEDQGGTDLPAGGTTGQVLAKRSDADSDTEWKSLGTAAEKNYTSNVAPDNHNLVESNAVYAAISSAISAVYEPHGDVTCAELTSDLLIEENVGNLYTVSDSGTTTDLFIQGAGKTISAGDSVAVIVAGPNVYKFNLMPGIVDLSDFQKKEIMPVTIAGESYDTVEEAIEALAEESGEYVDRYSTTETLTDKVWIDGKPIYRTVVDIGEMPAPNASSKTVRHNIADIDAITDFYGVVHNSLNITFKLPHVSRASSGSSGVPGVITMYVSSASISIDSTVTNSNSYSGYAVIEYTKVTP